MRKSAIFSLWAHTNHQKGCTNGSNSANPHHQRRKGELLPRPSGTPFPPLSPGCARHSVAHCVSCGISTKTATFLGEACEAYADAGFFNRFGRLDWSSAWPRPTSPWSSAKDDWKGSRGGVKPIGTPNPLSPFLEKRVCGNGKGGSHWNRP